ncbi:MAG: polymer-forming cytoskeletal protein [Brevibacillus sp.]|nr:polymer-forming cytoskeletal protein [Brevibacillus sp.]
MKMPVKVLLLMVVLLAGWGNACLASGVFSQDTYRLEKGETHVGDLFVSGRNVVIEGTVEGDVYSFAKTVQISGKVTGDLITFSADTAIRGEVDGDIRAFTQRLVVDGRVSRNITAFTQHLLLAETGEVGRNILAFVDTADLFGRTGGEANGFVAEMRITGEVGRGLSMLQVGSLQIEQTAQIGGDVRYSSHHEAIIAPGAKIEGEVLYTPIEPDPDEGPSFPFLSVAMSLISTLVLWLAVRYLLPQALLGIRQELDEKIGVHVGVGALLLLSAPILTLILIVTIIGIPLAVTLVAVVGLLLFTAKIFVGTWAGHRLADYLQWPLHPLLRELIGILGLYVLTQIPYLGWLAAAAIWLVFVGAVAAAVRRANTHAA